MSHFNTNASITEYWQGMISVLLDFLSWIRLRTYWCPHHFEFRNYRGVAWWYTHSQLASGQFEYAPLQYTCFHHRVLARNDFSFARFPDIWILLRTYWCPHYYEFRNYSGVAWWYTHSQSVSWQFEYVPHQYKCFHHRVLARNDVSFARFPDLDPSKNILVSTPFSV